MKNNAFNLRRFWLTLKWTVLTEKKSLITIAVGFLTAFLAIQLFSCFTIFDITQGLGREATFGGMVTCAGLMGLMGMYYASGLLGNARTSSQRTTVLMLPASNLERFTARLVYCCLFIPLLVGVAMLTATGLRMLLELLAGHADIISGLNYTDGFAVDSLFGQVSSLWTVSLFVLGGVFFRTRPFIWTSVTLFGGSLLLTTVVAYVGMTVGTDHLKNLFESFMSMSYDTLDWILSAVFTLFTVFNVWLSYRLYCRLQVVQHKWFNL